MGKIPGGRDKAILPDNAIKVIPAVHGWGSVLCVSSVYRYA